MRKLVKDTEEIILREYPDGSFTSVEVEKLQKKMKDIFSEEALIGLADKVPRALAGLRNMAFIAFIKSDIAGNNAMGWRQHQKALKEEGYDV